MIAFELDDLLAAQETAAKLYYEFIRKPTLSCGIYRLPAGGVDPQQPHTEDEVYYVISGRALVTVGAEERPVQSGSVVFVAAHVEHRFHSIDETLTLLVFFAPPEGSLQAT